MTAAHVSISVEEYAALPDSAVPTELVDGVVVELAASGAKHNWVRDRITGDMNDFTANEFLGDVLAETEFVTIDDIVRRPDILFIRAGRLTAEFAAKCPLRIVPNVVVEVVSPNDKVADLHQKISEYHAAGVETVCVVHLDGTADILHRDGTSMVHVRELVAPALPGYRLDLTELFARLPEWARCDS